LKDFEKRFRALETKIKAKWPRFNLLLFFQNNIDKNRDAIIHSLKQTLEFCDSKFPEAYAQTILDKESGNFNEKVAIKEHEKNKKLYAELLESLKNINNSS
jgi:hypothetical protein